MLGYPWLRSSDCTASRESEISLSGSVCSEKEAEDGIQGVSDLREKQRPSVPEAGEVELGQKRGKGKAAVIQAKDDGQFLSNIQGDLSGLIASPEKRLELAQDPFESIRGLQCFLIGSLMLIPLFHAVYCFLSIAFRSVCHTT